MKNYKYIILLLSVVIVLLLGIIMGKGCFSPEAKEKQKQVEYEKEYKRISDQQAEEEHRRMMDPANSLKNTR